MRGPDLCFGYQVANGQAPPSERPAMISASRLLDRHMETDLDLVTDLLADLVTLTDSECETVRLLDLLPETDSERLLRLREGD